MQVATHFEYPLGKPLEATGKLKEYLHYIGYCPGAFVGLFSFRTQYV